MARPWPPLAFAHPMAAAVAFAHKPTLATEIKRRLLCDCSPTQRTSQHSGMSSESWISYCLRWRWISALCRQSLLHVLSTSRVLLPSPASVPCAQPPPVLPSQTAGAPPLRCATLLVAREYAASAVMSFCSHDFIGKLAANSTLVSVLQVRACALEQRPTRPSQHRVLAGYGVTASRLILLALFAARPGSAALRRRIRAHVQTCLRLARGRTHGQRGSQHLEVHPEDDREAPRVNLGGGCSVGFERADQRRVFH